MSVRVDICRTVRLPDQTRVARCLRAPELGPRVLFFSGGSALRPLSRRLKEYTHNSVHLITPFDSGGSSAGLRAAFDMLSIGDLRNRLVALADESSRGNPQIYRLFCYRMAKDAELGALRQELDAMINGQHELVAAVEQPLRQIIQTHLGFFRARAAQSFDLRGANVGNLLLAGGYLSQDRNIRSTLFLFSKLLEVRGLVMPSAESTAHLAAELSNGEIVVGQHRLTGKEVAPLQNPIESFFLVDSLESPHRVTVQADTESLELVHKADVICFPMGSFYTSVLANLLPAGVGQAVAKSGCPKVYIPNMGHDPEQVGSSVDEALGKLLETLSCDVDGAVEPSRLVNAVLVDTERGQYETPVNKARIEAHGVSVIDTRLVGDDRPGVCPRLLAEILLTLAQ